MELLLACVLFLAGLSLSAFFSGSETGFYRASALRLHLDARGGDRAARRLLWFVKHPSAFVTTTLVGNNIANYLTTFAIGMAAAAIAVKHSGWIEVTATICLSPVVFVFGELLPKSLYFRAPMYFLKRGAWRFRTFYRVFLPISYPLMQLSRLFSRFGSTVNDQREIVLGRNRLAQVLTEGHREGILLDVQNQLVHGLIHTAARSLGDSIVPTNRLIQVPDSASREEMLDAAGRFGLTVLVVGETHYVRVKDLVTSSQPVTLLTRSLPSVQNTCTRLEALLTMRKSSAPVAAVTNGKTFVGVIYEYGLISQLFRTSQPIARFE